MQDAFSPLDPCSRHFGPVSSLHVTAPDMLLKRPWFPLHPVQDLSRQLSTGTVCPVRGISSWRKWRLHAFPSAHLRSRVAAYQTSFGVGASSKIQLLVDGDSKSQDLIKQAITCLEKEGYEVHTSLFAAPGREANRKWKQFMCELGINFCPVPRATTHLNQPNDDAIISAMMKQSSLAHEVSLALLTSDAGFVGPAADVQAKGTRVLVLTSQGRVGVVKKYEAAGLRVIKLESNDAAPKVRAILHEDGRGSVHMAEAFVPSAYPPPVDAVETSLERFGLKSGEGFLIQKCAKYWFENCEGSLTAYPPHLAFIAMHDILRSADPQSARTCFGHLAFILPVAGSCPHLKPKQKEKFGSRLARQVWRAGGPFMKQDSPTLVADVFQQLGWVGEASANLNEPMFCFVNRTHNKYQLRQVGMLPASGDGSSVAMQKLRAAFLSNASIGMWQTNQENFNEVEKVVAILRNAKLLPHNDAVGFSQDEIFAAMKVYAQREGLPSMRTFDALAIRICHHNNKSPDLRQLIEIE